MFPVLFDIPVFPAWVGGMLLLLVGAAFAFFALKDGEDRGSWWMAAAFAGGAAVLVVKFGFSGPIGPLPIRLFGILVVAGFLAGAKVVANRNSRLGLLEPDASFDLTFYILLVGLVGSRALHVFQHTDDFAGRPGKMLAIWDGGLVWYGGALASTCYAWWWLAKRNKDLWRVSDSLAMGVILAQAVGRLGCFAAGCDYGSIVEGGQESVPWAVNFPDHPLTLVPHDFRHDPLTDTRVYVHPVQIYLVATNLLTFGALWFFDRRGGKNAFPGRLCALYLILYAIGRGTVEHWRGDEDRGLYDLGLFHASFSQVASAGVLAAGILLYRSLRKRRKPGA